jgi:polyribonucleotide nucleotidyltransferase
MGADCLRYQETEVTLLEGPEIQFAEAVIDNGRFGTRTVRFETGRLAQQAAGSAMVYIDEDTALLWASTSSR